MRAMPASVNRAPMVTSSGAGEPVAGSCCGATAGACSGAGAGASLMGSTDTGVGATDTPEVDDEIAAVVELDATLELGLDDELELDGTLDELELELVGALDELEGTLDDELGGSLDEELLGGTLDEELGALDDELLEGLEVGVADAGPQSAAEAPSSSPNPSTVHPALADRSMKHPPALARRPQRERTPQICHFDEGLHRAWRNKPKCPLLV